jgi:PKD repeat protein
MKVKKHLGLVAALALTVVGGLSAQTLGGSDNRPGNGVEVGEPVTPVEINVDLRNLPTVDAWQPGDPIKEAQRRIYHPLTTRIDPSAPKEWATAPDRLADLQAMFDNMRIPATGIESAGRVTISNGSTGVSPGDPVVEVNNNYILYGINGSTGTTFTVYNKTGTKLSGPTTYKSLAPAGDPCATSVSDPIIHWDRLANRWFMLEMGGTSSSNRLCVYISKTDNPVSGGWWFYGFSTPSVPDYPHCSVWSNAYVCATNEGGSGISVYAFDRANMLNGATARAAQRFTSVPKLAGYGFQTLTPVTFMGATAPPANAPLILARHNDDEAHAGTGANTSADYIDLFAMNINWTTPASSSITTLPHIAITEFNSWFRDYSSFATVPQPGSTSLLDPIREVIMNSLSYRNFGSYESIVGSFATNQNAARTGTVVDSGIRWFEVRKSGSGNWALYQEGTFSPGDSSTHHLLSAISQDKQGNIGMGYNVSKTSSPTVYASLRYTGRLNTDALGIMSQGENEVATGAAAETSGRWGDYYQMVVDPTDDCTFWFVGMYRPSGSWATRASDFKFSNCGGTPPTTYSIAGQVTTSTGVGISGVTVSTGSASSTTDASGNYSIPSLVAGSYTLTPSASGYTFSPTSRAVTIGTSNVTGQNFTGTAAASTYSISGTVATSGGAGISGVTVSTGSASATTNASGAYTISNLANGTYTLTPSLAGYTFSPTSLSATVSGANLTGRNFTGSVIVSGPVALSNGVGVAGSTNSTSANSSWTDYTVAIPAGASNLVIATSGASGDVDLHVKFGAQATTTVYDCRPYSSSGNETCTFATPSTGIYYVRVYGYATGTQTFTVTASWTNATANVPPTANFTFTTSSLTASFTDTSSDSDGTIASRSWSFGDGGTSTATNPSRTYAAAGTYTVSLTVTDNNGASNSTSRSVTVSAPANLPPTANFTFTTSNLTASFTDTSTDSDGSIASRSWAFGDGGTSTATNPSRTYAAAGTYTVSLTVTDNNGASNSTSRSVTVTAAPPGGAVALSNGVGASGSTSSTSANSSWADFTVAIPAGASNLTIATSASSGDVDLYVKAGAQATLSVYDCRPYTGSGNESCSFATPTAGTYYVRVYGYATGALSFTVTASWTVGGGGGGGGIVERMSNGNFDSITSSTNSAPDGSWSRTASTGTSFNTLLAGQTNAQSPSSYAYLGVQARASSQTVDSKATLIPAGATTATLSFHTSIVTSETSTTTAYDKLQVQLIDASTNAVITTLVTLSNVNKTTSASTYVQRSYDVSAYKGRNVKVRLYGTTDGSLATTFRVDTVSLMSDG